METSSGQKPPGYAQRFLWEGLVASPRCCHLASKVLNCAVAGLPRRAGHSPRSRFLGRGAGTQAGGRLMKAEMDNSPHIRRRRTQVFK